MEEATLPSYLLVFQCNSCMHILFTQKSQSDDQSNLISSRFDTGSQLNKYSLQSPLQGNLYLKNISIVSDGVFQSELFCSACNNYVTEVQLLQSEILLVQNQNIIVQSLHLQNQCKNIVLHNKDSSLDTLIEEQNEIIYLDFQENSSKTQNIIQNPYIEIINLNKRLEKFVSKERQDFEELEQSVSQLEVTSEKCIKMTEEVVSIFQNTNKQELLKNQIHQA